MREILAQIEGLSKEAKSFRDQKKFDEAQKKLDEIAELQKEFGVEKAIYDTEKNELHYEPEKEKGKLSEDEKAFVDYCRSVQTEKTLSRGTNGAIIPSSIASKIIDTVKELCPIYSKCDIYNVKGILNIPVYGKDGEDDVQAAYATEFVDLTAHQGKFTSIDLNTYLVGALSKISKSLINNTDVDVLQFIVNKIAKAIADFLEKELLVGTGSNAMTGATKTTNVNTLTTKTVAGYTADVFIDTQLMVPEVYQANAIWIMHKDLLKSVRKLKDNDGNYLMTKSLVEGFAWDILGKPVYTSENMPAPTTASGVPVLYGDMKGMACKLSKDVEIQILNELFAAQHAVGVVGWVEVDSKIQNSQMFVGIKNSAA